MILASKSPRRKEILENLGINIEIIVPDIEEISDKKEIAEKIADIALKKAKKVGEVHKKEYITAADTVVVCNNEILGKPKNKQEAYEMLKKLSGKTHEVITGFAFININSKIEITNYEKSLVTFKELSESDIVWYLDSTEPFDKAGAYGIQGKGALFIKKIEGDFFSVMGFPAYKFIEEIKKVMNIEIKEILEL